jgi:hypothetical protein
MQESKVNKESGAESTLGLGKAMEMTCFSGTNWGL